MSEPKSKWSLPFNRAELIARIEELESAFRQIATQAVGVDYPRMRARQLLGLDVETEGYENVSISKGAMCRTCETIPCRCQAKVEPGIGGNLISGGCYTPKTEGK